MDSMDRYLASLNDPAVRAFNRKLRGIDEDDREPARSNVTEDHIRAAEEGLGLILPPSYKKLVLTAQPFDVEYGLHWVWDNEADQFIQEIVSTNRPSEGWLPPFLIVVMGLDSGDYYCFDTRHPDERGEYPIVFLDHEIHGEDSTDFDPVARDLGEFLLGLSDGRTALD